VVTVAGVTFEALPYEALTKKLFTDRFGSSGAVRWKITHLLSSPFSFSVLAVALGRSSFSCGGCRVQVCFPVAAG
jgi:hypothetical protein